MLKIKIMRHSERYDHIHYLKWWSSCLWVNISDSPLTENGINMADAKGKELLDNGFCPNVVFSSPYTRTIDTSIEILKYFPKADFFIEPLLSEFQYWYAHTTFLYKEGIPCKYKGEDTNYNFPESYQEFDSRVNFIMEKIINDYKSKNTILIITHSEFIKSYINFIKKNTETIINEPAINYLTSVTFDYDINNSCIDGKSVIIE